MLVGATHGKVIINIIIHSQGCPVTQKAVVTSCSSASRASCKETQLESAARVCLFFALNFTRLCIELEKVNIFELGKNGEREIRESSEGHEASRPYE